MQCIHKRHIFGTPSLEGRIGENETSWKVEIRRAEFLTADEACKGVITL